LRPTQHKAVTAPPDTGFDAFAEDYEEALERGVGLSGEDSSFFAEGRVAWVGHRLAELGLTVPRLLDFGCGTGSTAPLLLDLPGAEHVLGTDVSKGLLDVARRDHGADQVDFALLGSPPPGCIDLAYCNGVFHHIPPAERGDAVDYVWSALRSRGLFALWENNPWNPATRLVMRRIPFDRDAITLSAPETRRLLQARGFDILRTDFLFVFPRQLAALRRAEPALARLPLGAQYLVLAVKPEAA
jgi:SAM-dependent methyltransferase